MIQEVIGQVIVIAVFLILVRILLPEDFGLVALASTFMAFFGPFITQGLGAAIIQREHIDDKHLDTAFWMNVSIGITLAVIAILVSPLIAALFKQPELAPIIAVLSASFVFQSLSSVQQAIVRRNMNFKVLAVRSMVAQVVGGIVGVGMAIMDYGVWSLVAMQIVQSLVGVFLLWRISDWRPRMHFSIAHFKDLFGFGMSIMGSELLVLVNRRSDNLRIGFFLGPVALGYYSVAYQLIKIIYHLITKVVYMVGMPAFSRIQTDKKKVSRVFLNMTEMIALIAMPVFIGLLILVPQIVPTFFGKQWLPSVPVMQVLPLIGIVHCMLRPMAAVIMGLGKPDWRMRLQLFDAVLNLVGFLIAVKWGIGAVAISYVIVGFIQSPLWFWTVNKLVDVEGREYLRTLSSPFLSVIIMICSVAVLQNYVLIALPS